MKVIKNNYKEENTKWVCPNCNSILELDKYDINKCSIICPCCNTTTPLIYSIKDNGIYTYSGETIKTKDSDICDNCGCEFYINEKEE